MAATDVFSLQGKAAVVTGAAMGIGFGIAKRFVEDGANVLLVDRDQGAVEGAVAKLRDGKGRAVGLQADIGDDATPARIVAASTDAFGGVDILVNNAGIFPSVPVLDMDAEVFDRVLRINLRGLVFVSKAVAARMVGQRRGGKIVNIGSIDSLHPSMVGLAAYDASKGGVLMFTRALALELAPHGIRVNAILPGGIATEGASKPLQGSGMTKEQLDALRDKFVRQVPLGRMGLPDDIARVAHFLSSGAADYVTGAHLVVDGGRLLF